VAELDPVNLGLDPTEATIEKVAEKAKAAVVATGVTDEGAIRRAADDSIRAMMLIRTYRVRGHLAANLDPLGLSQRELPADLTPAYHGFGEGDLDPKDLPQWRARLSRKRRSARSAGPAGNYCGTGRPRIYAHQRPGGAPLPQERMEGNHAAITFTPEGKRSILEKVIHGEQWEKFLAKKYVGTKRFGLDGGESAIPRAGSGDQIWRPVWR
jgi:2-oxoglutarate dehydrogenase E1 component